MEIEKSGWKCWVALPNRIFVSSPVVYLQNDGTNGIFVLCSVLYFYQVSERSHPVKDGLMWRIFFPEKERKLCTN